MPRDGAIIFGDLIGKLDDLRVVMLRAYAKRTKKADTSAAAEIARLLKGALT